MFGERVQPKVAQHLARRAAFDIRTEVKSAEERSEKVRTLLDLGSHRSVKNADHRPARTDQPCLQALKGRPCGLPLGFHPETHDESLRPVSHERASCSLHLTLAVGSTVDVRWMIPPDQLYSTVASNLSSHGSR